MVLLGAEGGLGTQGRPEQVLVKHSLENLSVRMLLKTNGTDLRDNRTVPYIVKVVGDVVDHGDTKLPKLLAGCHPQGLPLKETCKSWQISGFFLLEGIQELPPPSSATVVRENQ